MSEPRPIHATFREAVKQLAGASEEYQREGIHFLRALLNPDHAKHLTAQQALDHPFLTNAFDSVAPDSLPPKIEKPIPIDNTLTRAVRKACQKFWEKKMPVRRRRVRRRVTRTRRMMTGRRVRRRLTRRRRQVGRRVRMSLECDLMAHQMYPVRRRATRRTRRRVGRRVRMS